MEYGIIFDMSNSFLKSLRNIISENEKHMRAKIPKTVSELIEMLKGNKIKSNMINEMIIAIPKYNAHQ